MRRYLIIFGTTVTAILLLTAALALIFEPFVPLTGDLTRIGNYAEKDFGWTAPQPVIHITANGKAVSAPNILVLGDSFTQGNAWQSILTERSGRTTQSFQFYQVGCIKNWLNYAFQHSTADTIVIESVERSFLANFKELPECAAGTPQPFEITPATTAAQRRQWPPEWHIQRTFKLSYHTLRMQLHADTILRNGEVANAPIDRACAGFSNRRADRLLYFVQDEEKFRWKQDDVQRAIANILAIQQAAAQHGKKFVLIVAPDKLSVYQRCLLHPEQIAERDPHITAALIAAGIHTPDLRSVFRDRAGKITDLYQSDDTHPNAAGYVLMGEQIAAFLSKPDQQAPK
ncbi:MAG: hypothetical protein JSS58_10205 [Proteobacteria bacterium]|nr:hypothetical protein [Pseudomonadota bacterium]